MDNLQITELINRCKQLKHRFRGIFSANLAFNTILKGENTFTIVNASNSDQPGTHWLLFAQAGGRIFFADPLGRSLHNYPPRCIHHPPRFHHHFQRILFRDGLIVLTCIVFL